MCRVFTALALHILYLHAMERTHLANIREKIQLLQKEQFLLMREAEKLREQVMVQQEQLALLAEKNDALQQQVEILRTAAGQNDSEAKKQFEKRINQYLKDIDQVIAHLNQ